MPTVVIVGAGAIGLLFASFFKEANWNVHLVVRHERTAQCMRTNGISYVRGEEQRRYEIEVTEVVPPQADLYVYAMKYDDLIPLLGNLPNGPKLFIQNGMAHYDQLRQVNIPHCYFASVEHGAKRLDVRTVEHTGVGSVWMSERDVPAQMRVLLTLRHAQIVWSPFTTEQLLLRKAVINSCINPLTALLRVPNGQLIEGERLQWLREVYEEITIALPDVSSLVSFEEVVNICRKTAKNDSSMFVDVQRKRPTEIETIVTPLIVRGEAAGAPMTMLRRMRLVIRALPVQK